MRGIRPEEEQNYCAHMNLPEPVVPAHRSYVLLKGQPALVTGANSGIGHAITVAFGRDGADVIVNYVVNPDDAEAEAEEIRPDSADEEPRAGGRREAHPDQFDRARRHPDADQHGRVLDARSLCRADEAGALQAHRRDRGDRPRGSLAVLGLHRLHRRHDVLYRRWDDVAPRVRNGGEHHARTSLSSALPDQCPCQLDGAAAFPGSHGHAGRHCRRRTGPPVQDGIRLALAAECVADGGSRAAHLAQRSFVAARVRANAARPVRGGHCGFGLAIKDSHAPRAGRRRGPGAPACANAPGGCA